VPEVKAGHCHANSSERQSGQNFIWTWHGISIGKKNFPHEHINDRFCADIGLYYPLGLRYIFTRSLEVCRNRVGYLSPYSVALFFNGYRWGIEY
jgi:hypothetical protein